MNTDTHFICTVCNRRWGIEKEGAEMVGLNSWCGVNRVMRFQPR